MDNLNKIEYHVIPERDDQDNPIIQIYLYKIDKFVLATGQAVAKSNHIYKAKIPREYCPVAEFSFTGQSNASNTLVNTATLFIEQNGTIKTVYPYNNALFLFTVCYRTK